MAAGAQYGKQRAALSQHRRRLPLDKSASKHAKNDYIPLKTPRARLRLLSFEQNHAVLVEKQATKRSDEAHGTLPKAQPPSRAPS